MADGYGFRRFRAYSCMADTCFTLSSRRQVTFRQFHVRVSTLKYLLGAPDLVRSEVLRELPREVAQRYGRTGLLLKAPPEGELPPLTCFLHLESDPIKGADFSSLVVVWFAESLPSNVQSCIVSQIATIDWELFAKDAHF